LDLIRSVMLMAALAAVGIAVSVPQGPDAARALRALAHFPADRISPHATLLPPRAMDGRRDRAPLAPEALDPNGNFSASRAVGTGGRFRLPGIAAPSDDGGGVPVPTQRTAGDPASAVPGSSPGRDVAAAPWRRLPGIPMSAGAQRALG
jgi:hypothetical protein